MIANNDLRGIYRDEIWGCRLLWWFCFAILLPVATLARATGWRWQPWPAGPDGYKSIMQEADTMAKSVVAITYSSY